MIPHAVTIERFARAIGDGKHLIHAREKNRIAGNVESGDSSDMPDAQIVAWIHDKYIATVSDLDERARRRWAAAEARSLGWAGVGSLWLSLTIQLSGNGWLASMDRSK